MHKINRNIIKSIFFLLFIFILCFCVVFKLQFAKSESNSENLSILYLNYHNYSGNEKDAVLTSLSLDPSFKIEQNKTKLEIYSSGLEILNDFDIIFLVEPNLTSEEIMKINDFINNGGGLIYIFGENQNNLKSQLVEFNIIKNSAISMIENNKFKGIASVNKSANVFDSIDWGSCAEIANYTILPNNLSLLGFDFDFNVNLIIENKNTEIPLILTYNEGIGRIIVITAWFGDPKLKSQHLWPYFNYLIYSFCKYAANQQKLSYSHWKYSPTPHEFERIIWLCFVSSLIFITIFIFIKQKRKSSEILESNIYQKMIVEIKKKSKLDIKEEKLIQQTKNLENPNSNEKNDSIEPTLSELKRIDEWEEIGYHRQLSGFMYALFLSFFLIGPQLGLTLWIYPNFILPFPQAAGYYSFVQRFFEAFWLFLDFGTATAAAKFFAQYRVKQPERAIRYVQIYIWWQFLSGVGQFAFVSFLGLYIFPETKYAHMSWFFILHSMIQFPGFLAVFLYFFQGVQKLDTAQMLEIFRTVIFHLIFQYLLVLLFRNIFRNIPQYGEVFGAVVGLAVGQWIGEWIFFWFSFKVFKKQGYTGQLLFRIDFRKDELKETFKYGVKLVVGNVWVPLVWFLQVILISIYVKNYSSEMAFFDMAYVLTQVMSLVGLYLGGMMPPISEALGNKRFKLLDFGIVEMLRIMNWIAFSLGAILLVVGNRIIIGLAGPTWKGATFYFIGLLIHAIMGPYSWSADRVFQGTGRTDLNLYTWILEQGMRAIGLFLLVPKIGMVGVIIAYNIALASKDIAVWILIRRIIWKGKVYFLKSFIAPLLTSICLYLILEMFANFIWKPDVVSTIILVLLGIFGGIYLSAFFAGFFGLWDENTLKEFEKAARMVKTVGFMAQGLYKLAEFGALKLKNPFYKKCIIDIYEEAKNEAISLTNEKKVLII